MSEKNEPLFEESSQGSVSLTTTISVVVSLVLMIGGLIMLSYGFNPSAGAAYEIGMFVGGIVVASLGFAIPFLLLPALRK